MAERRVAGLGIGLIAAGILLLAAAAVLGAGSLPGRPATWGLGPGGMMGFGGAIGGSPPDPGSPGFIAGSPSAPRIVRIVASGSLRFAPDVVTVKQGETITFEVTSMGMASHEFMVGPAADVAADVAGTPEVATSR
ncbi:MAG: hypothetical protein HY264_01590 [Chloroflexi bacterium]|nr:hypothetical protein [Chloroflexota bacterium]